MYPAPVADIRRVERRVARSRRERGSGVASLAARVGYRGSRTRFLRRNYLPRVLIVSLAICCVCEDAIARNAWTVDTAEQWQKSCRESENLTFEEGMATPTEDAATYRSIVTRWDEKRVPKSMVFRQSPVWHNWEPIDNLGPANLRDAPVLLTMGPDDYWIFGRYGGGRSKRGQRQQVAETFKSGPAKLEGFDIPLRTTPFPNQYDAPGGLEKGLGGYHAWQSRDMTNWVHHGPVTERFSCWVTTAEQADGKVYIYYDYPNDQDPHLYVDDDLADGKPGRNMGLAFADPSDGSDCAFIRDLQGNFHVIYEDWSPINARKHSWDSPLGGHAVSADGIGHFEIKAPAVDERTKSTGKKATYLHPHWKQHPDWDSNVAEYTMHEPDQNAFGDWAAISVGGQYYLFCDYHPVGDKIRVAWFTSDSIDKPFARCGEIGLGHPDPDIAFAEGRFYLVTQMKTDYVSPGPWVDEVEARVGADTDNDGKADTWTNWQKVSESYDYIEGFSKQVERVPASIDLSGLPPCSGLCFEFKTKDTTENVSKPIIDAVTISFEKE